MRALLNAQTRWTVLFDLAERHGVQPLLAQGLLQADGLIPHNEVQNLKQNYLANLHKALLLSGELIRILDCLSAAGIEVMPYKGLALAETLYGDIALRQAGDIDLLVRATDFKRTREAVRELGYTPHSTFSRDEEEAYLKSGYECAFDGPAGRNLLEVQWAIQPAFYAVDFDMEGLVQRAIRVKVAGVDVKSPCPEDMFLVLALHAAKHVWGRLIWLCDLARISARSDLNWEWIAAQARELGIVRMLRVTLLLAEQILGAPIPAKADSSLPADSVSVELAEEIERHVVDEKTFDVESLAYFRLMLRLRERRIDRARFIRRMVLTPGPGEWSLVRLPKALFPLYRVVRVARLAARTVAGRI